MSAASVNWLIELGATLSQTWAFKSNGAVYVLTGWHCEVQIRPTPDSSVLLFAGDDTTIGNVAIDGTAGTVTITDPSNLLDALDLSSLPAGKIPIPDPTKSPVPTACGRLATYGVVLIDPYGVRHRVIQAQVVFSQSVVK